MNSRERFENTVKFSEPDRVPVDYLSQPAVDKALKEYYEVKTERELLDALGSDFYYLSCRDISQNESCYHIYKGPRLEVTEKERVCPFGIRWKRKAYDSKFAVDEAIEGPLENATSESDILNYKWPEVEWFDFEHFLKEVEDNSDRVIVGGFWTGILGDCYRMLGFENFLYNIAAKPVLTRTLINKMTDFYSAMNEKVFSQLKGKIDVWFFGNDFGTQGGLLFSREMFGEFFLDDIKRLCKQAHGHGVKVMMHSCGAVRDIIPLLIDAGVDILDPIQVTAEGMEPAELKKEFGNKLVFHGGIDTQHLLPESKPEKIYKHCLEMINMMGKDGGYIFAPSQILDIDIPVENIAAMYKAAKDSK